MFECMYAMVDDTEVVNDSTDPTEVRFSTPYMVVITTVESDEVGPIHSFENVVRDTELGGCHHM